jgi:Protein of unknown function DUF262
VQRGQRVWKRHSDFGERCKVVWLFSALMHTVQDTPFGAPTIKVDPMKMLPSDPDIQTIFARIESGDLDLQPNFQRGEVWTTAKKKKLIDSILRDWHVPPIHVVVGGDGKQEVLDGQQRLVAIRDFINGLFRVDGNSEPYDPAIAALDNYSYSDLPPEVKRGFEQFTIRVFRLTDYLPGEPGELFFRLNQMTYLTAAEQRNAFFGPVREQVRSLVEILESAPTFNVVGFSNKRMAYDDVLAKLLCTFESGTLGAKLGAVEISNRFRASKPFSDEDIDLARRLPQSAVSTGLVSRPSFAEYGQLSSGGILINSPK